MAKTAISLPAEPSNLFWTCFKLVLNLLQTNLILSYCLELELVGVLGGFGGLVGLVGLGCLGGLGGLGWMGWLGWSELIV